LGTQSGSGYIPPFRATNTTDTKITGEIHFTLSYGDGQGCVSPEFVRKIHVTPKTNVDLDLVAAPVEGQVICLDGSFSAITFEATDRGVTVSARYRIEFVSGDNILSNTGLISANPWTPTASKAGKGVYRIVPVYNNREGVAALFSLEARVTLTAGMVAVAGLAYQNGDFVPAIELSKNLPDGASISWTATGNTIGMATTGIGEIPAFIASNTTGSATSATVEYTVRYIDGLGCTASGSFDITVTPKTNVDLDLVADAIEGQITCVGEPFTEITFVAKDAKNANISITGNNFRIEFVSSDNIFGIPNGLVAKWTPSSAKAGKAVYRAVPIYDNREGVAALFSLEARARLTTEMVNIDGLTYRNGDPVPAIDLSKNLPEGAIVTWTATGNTIGMAASGIGVIPGFTASNTTGIVTTAKVIYTVKYADNPTLCPVTGDFTISVEPRTNVDIDLVANPVAGQTKCVGDQFDEIEFAAKDAANGNISISGNYFRIEFVDGDNIFTIPTGLVDKWLPLPARSGKAVYRAVPVYSNREGVPALFSLEARPHLNAPETWQGDYGLAEPQEIFNPPCTGDSLVLSATTGYGFRYQWYWNQTRIEGATGAVYTLPQVQVSQSGYYQVIVMDVCNVISTKTFLVKPNINIIRQKWDVIMAVNTYSVENGGFNIVPGSFLWSEIDPQTGIETPMAWETKSYIYVAEGVKGKTYRVSFLTAEGERYESCPVTGVEMPARKAYVYPNPVSAGETLTVRIDAGETDLLASRIQLSTLSGTILYEKDSPSEYTPITIYMAQGIYIIRVYIGNSYREELKIIVK
jgi:hypothetical protein